MLHIVTRQRQGSKYPFRFLSSFLPSQKCESLCWTLIRGMNVSFQDGYNIGWKLASVFLGQAHASLLETYVSERQKVAVELIEFDRDFSKLWASGTTTGKTATPEQFTEAFLKSSKYTSGTNYRYDDSIITWTNCRQELAVNVIVGMRMPSAQVVRHCDSKPMQLAKALPSDGRWRILVFAGDLSHNTNLHRLDKVVSTRLAWTTV